MRALPGGPFDFSGDKSLPKAVTENLKRRYHLDWAMPWQFSSYLLGDDVASAICGTVPVLAGCDKVLTSTNLGVARGLIRGDLGMAMRQRGRTVNDIIGESFPISLQLGILAIAFGLLTGIPLGTFAALHQNSWIDYTASFVAVLGLSVPSLVLGPVLIWVFALNLGWFPVSTWGAKPPFFLGFIPMPTMDFCHARRSAGDGAGRGADGEHCAPDARQPAPSDRRGLYPYGTRQGPAGAAP